MYLSEYLKTYKMFFHLSFWAILVAANVSLCKGEVNISMEISVTYGKAVGK